MVSHKAAVLFLCQTWLVRGGVFKWPYLSRQQNHTLGVDQIEVENEQGVVEQDIFMETKC